VRSLIVSNVVLQVQCNACLNQTCPHLHRAENVEHHGTLCTSVPFPRETNMSNTKSNQSPTPDEWRKATDYALKMGSNMSRAEQGDSKEESVNLQPHDESSNGYRRTRI